MSVGPYQIFSGIDLEICQNRITTYVCPSDPQKELKDAPNRKTNVSGVADTTSAWQASSTIGQHPIKYGDGMMLNTVAKKVGDVFDGTSNTLFVGEVTGGEEGSNDGPTWYHGQTNSTAFGINGPNTIPGEGVYRYNASTEIGFSSYHPGGAHFLLVDGSVRFFSESIDAAVLFALTTRAAGDIVSASAY